MQFIGVFAKYPCFSALAGKNQSTFEMFVFIHTITKQQKNDRVGEVNTLSQSFEADFEMQLTWPGCFFFLSFFFICEFAKQN